MRYLLAECVRLEAIHRQLSFKSCLKTGSIDRLSHYRPSCASASALIRQFPIDTANSMKAATRWLFGLDCRGRGVADDRHATGGEASSLLLLVSVVPATEFLRRASSCTAKKTTNAAGVSRAGRNATRMSPLAKTSKNPAVNRFFLFFAVLEPMGSCVVGHGVSKIIAKYQCGIYDLAFISSLLLSWEVHELMFGGSKKVYLPDAATPTLIAGLYAFAVRLSALSSVVMRSSGSNGEYPSRRASLC